MKKTVYAALASMMLCVCCAKSDKLNGNKYVNDSNNGVEISLSFAKDENRMFGEVVNNYFATYTVDGNKLVFNGIGSTMMMGPEDAMKVERDYFNFMNETPIEYSVNGDTLTLKNNKGETFVFKKAN